MEAISRVMGRIESIQTGAGLGAGSFAAALASAQRSEAPTAGIQTAMMPSSPYGLNAFFPTVSRETGVAGTGELRDYLSVSGVDGRNGYLRESDLAVVSGAWDDRPARLLPPAAKSWEKMRSAAAADGVDLRTIDTYRSWDAQAAGHAAYLSGDKPAYVAPPGHSEHGFGLAVDVTNGALVGAGDAEWEWLQRNASRFGWHPISGETWHWEFRGA